MEVKNVVLVFFSMMLVTGSAVAAEPMELKTAQDKTSYAIGMDIAFNLMRNKVEVNPDVLGQGMKDILTNQTPLLSEQKAKKLLADAMEEMQTKRDVMMQELAEKNKSESEIFIPPNLAYGDKGGGPIGPNAALIFDVELVSVQPSEYYRAVPPGHASRQHQRNRD